MGYHILERIRGSPDAPYILLWKRLGIDYDLPIVPRDEDIPPNRVRLVAVKTVSETGDLEREIDERVEWDLYEPYGSAASEPYGRFPPDELVQQQRNCESESLLKDIAGTLPIPPAFVADHHLELGHYLECFITAVCPSGNDEWIVPYSAQTPPPTGKSPEFDPATVRSTVTSCEVELE